MTGNLYVLLGLAEAIVSHLPVAVRRSTTFARRVSIRRIGPIGTMKGSTLDTRAVGARSDTVCPNAARAGEALAP